MTNERKVLGLVLLLVLALVGTLSAQSTRGTLGGVVTDKTGAVVTNATVTVTPVTGGEPRTTTTGPNGEYRVEALSPQEYNVAVTASGFAPTKVEHVVIRVSQVTSQNVTVGITGGNEQVTVEATPDAVQTETGELSKTIPVSQVKDVPYANLNPYSLATSLPGVTTVQSRDDFTNGTSFSVNGLRPRANNFLLDGFDNNDNAIAGQAFQPNNVEAVQEVTVLTNSYSAEYGRGGGSVSNLTFRSGTNNFHGAVWDQYSASRFNAISSEDKANNPGLQREDCTAAQLARPEGCTRGPSQFVNNIPGFRIGGPVIKNKLFLFGTSQWNRNFGAFTGVPTLFIPNAAGIATLKNIAAGADPATAGRINVLLGSMGFAVGQGSVGSSFIGNRPGCTNCQIEFGQFSRTDAAPSLSREWTIRGDYTLTNDNFFARYTDSFNSLSPDLFNNAQLPGMDTQQSGPSRLFGAMWSHTFSPTVINEFRFSAQQINFTFGPTAGTLAQPFAQGPTFNFLGNNTSPDSGFGDSGTPIGGFSLNGTFPQGRGHKTFQFQDAVSWNKGTHNIKLGADLAHLEVNDAVPFNSNGAIFIGGTGATATECSDLANYLDGLTGNVGTAITRSFGNPFLSVPTTQMAYYVQDSWKVKSNLTLDLGVRYEYQPQDPNNVVQFPSIDRAQIATAGFQTRFPVRADRNNWGPRLGFAYTPHFGEWFFGRDKTVIRGGAGVFYDAFFTNISDNTVASSPNALGGSLVAGTGRGTNFVTAFPGITAAASPLTTITTVQDNLQNPQTYQWNLNIQRELPSKTMFEVAYVGTRGTYLWVNEQLNPRGAPVNFTSSPRLDPLRGSIVARSNGGDSVYHGLQTTVSRNVGHLSLRGSYTWSRAIDDMSEVFVTTGGASRWENVFNPTGDRGPSAFHRTHRGAITYVYEIPFPKENHILNAILGGWASAGEISFQSGAPDTIFLNGRDVNGDGETANDRPVDGNHAVQINYSKACLAAGSGCNTGVGVVSTTGAITAFGSGAAVTADQVRYLIFPVNSGINGNVGRNSFYWPGRQDWNLSAIKRINMPYREGHQVEFRADFFNAFNHPNEGVGGLQGNLLSSNFQNIDLTRRGGRTMAFWLKYQF